MPLHGVACREVCIRLVEKLVLGFVVSVSDGVLLPGTEAFASKLAASGKPLITLDSPANGNLVELGLVVAKAGSDGMLLSRSTKRLTDRISIMKGDETFFLLFPMQVSRV